MIGLNKGKEKEKHIISKCCNKDKPRSLTEVTRRFTERVVLYLFSNFGSSIVNINISIIILFSY